MDRTKVAPDMDRTDAPDMDRTIVAPDMDRTTVTPGMDRKQSRRTRTENSHRTTVAPDST